MCCPYALVRVDEVGALLREEGEESGFFGCYVDGAVEGGREEEEDVALARLDGEV